VLVLRLDEESGLTDLGAEIVGICFGLVENASALLFSGRGQGLGGLGIPEDFLASRGANALSAHRG
jgi:hypothetical protein